MEHFSLSAVLLILSCGSVCLVEAGKFKFDFIFLHEYFFFCLDLDESLLTWFIIYIIIFMITLGVMQSITVPVEILLLK